MSYLNDYSLSGWIKIHSQEIPGNDFLTLEKEAQEICFSVMGGRTNEEFRNDNSSKWGNYTINAGTTLQDGNWHNVIFTFDKGGDGMKLYIDGVLVGSNAYNTASFSDWGTGQNFYLGKANWNDPYFDGEMDQISVHNVALNGTMIYRVICERSKF